MTPRRSRAGGQSRQQIAQRLRDRRLREEILILEAAESLARREAAERAVGEAAESLTSALDELQRLGFELSEVATLLEITPAELAGTGSSRRQTARTSQPNQPNESASTDEDRGLT